MSNVYLDILRATLFSFFLSNRRYRSTILQLKEKSYSLSEQGRVHLNISRSNQRQISNMYTDISHTERFSFFVDSHRYH